MANFWKQRAERKRLRFSAMGKASQRAQRGRRDADLPERLRYLEEIEVQNLPRHEGDPTWGIRITNYSTGKVWKWTLRIGKRRNQVTMHAPSGAASRSVSMTWIMDHLRGYLAGTKTPLTPDPTTPIMHASGDALHGVGLPVGPLSSNGQWPFS